MPLRYPLILILALVLFGGPVVLAQETTPGDATTLRTAETVELVYGDQVFETTDEYGPVLAYVDQVTETEAGVEVAGTLLVRDETGWRVAGSWLDPAPSAYAGAIPGEVLPLAVPDELGATE